jgi:hypothetical protein
MNLKNSPKKSWMINVVSLLGASAAAVVMGLPALAEPTGGGDGFNNYANPFSPADSSNSATTDPNYGEPSANDSSREPNRVSDRDMNRSNGRQISRDMQESGQESGPSNAPGESYPGPSESPSGSPSVPGTSTYDDPALNEQENRGTFDQSRDSRDMQPDTMRPGMNPDGMEQMEQTGPSNAPDQSVPGASETPSGSPSVDGTSNQDNPNRTN